MENKAKLNNILQDAVKVITNPVGFYREMPKTGGYADPVIFVLVMAVLMGLVVALFSLFGAGVAGAMVAGFGAIILMPIFALIGSFIGAAILFVIWKLMGSSESYETAYRCAAYSAAIYPVTFVLGLIPYIGAIVGVVWGTYLMITASIEVQRLSRKTVYTVFGILGALLVVINVSTEIATRNMASKVEALEKQFGVFGQQFGQSGEMTPEQAGKAMGGFFKGMENATKYMRESTGDANADRQPWLSNNAAVRQEQAGEMTSEEAGKAIGDLFKGMGNAAKYLDERAGDVNMERESGLSNNAASSAMVGPEQAELTPEEAGKTLGEFFKGMGAASRNINENDGAGKESGPSDSAGSKDTMTPEQAGKALGDFMKAFGEATKDVRE